MDVTRIRIADYDYPLPQERIAAHPCEPRDACKLLAVGEGGRASHHPFRALPSLLEPGTLLVCNNTRVINARIAMRKATGAAIEIFCLEPLSPADYDRAFAATGSCRWSCLVGNLKKWKGETLEKSVSLPGAVEGVLSARYVAPLAGAGHEVEFSWTPADATFATIIEAAGNIPIPPYLNRASEQADTHDYQTVYSRVKGSVAAPTAGLHFTPALLDSLTEAGVERRELTLHVGAGTFQPVKSEEIGEHPMHTEVFSVERALVEELLKAVESGRTVGAVGTTTVRTLESLPYIGRRILRGEPLHVEQWEAYDGDTFSTAESLRAILAHMDASGSPRLTASTAIMIAPGFRWRIVCRVVTNFHQPKSTLLLLVASFLQRHEETPRPGEAPLWRRLYDEALANGYRFLSYGDAMLLS